MKFFSSPASMLSVGLVSLVLAGCAAGPMKHHGEHHDASRGPMGMGQKDMMAMCPMHDQMIGSMSPEQRKAMMAEQMKNMPPEMRQQRLQMMQEHVKMMQEVMAAQPAPSK